MIRLYLAGIALAALVGGAFWAGHHRGWDARDKSAAEEMTALRAKLNQAWVDAQVRVRQADIETTAITLRATLEVQALDLRAPIIVQESTHAIDQSPDLAACRLPDDLRRLREQQAMRSAKVAGPAPGAGG